MIFLRAFQIVNIIYIKFNNNKKFGYISYCNDSDNEGHEKLRLYKWKKKFKISGSALVFVDLTQTNNTTTKQSKMSSKDPLMKFNTLNSSRYIEQLSGTPLNLVPSLSHNARLESKINFEENEEEQDDDGFAELEKLHNHGDNLFTLSSEQPKVDMKDKQFFLN